MDDAQSGGDSTLACTSNTIVNINYDVTGLKIPSNLKLDVQFLKDYRQFMPEVHIKSISSTQEQIIINLMLVLHLNTLTFMPTNLGANKFS